MEKLLSEINMNAGVVGSVVLDKDAPLIRGNLPSFFRADNLHTFADHVRRLSILGEDSGGFHGMEFCYNHATVVARTITDRHILLTFCLPETDVQQVHLQHNVLLSELQDSIKKMPAIVPPDEPESIPEPEETVPKKRLMVFRGATYDE